VEKFLAISSQLALKTGHYQFLKFILTIVKTHVKGQDYFGEQ
tara:strand:+ start:117 stop:242 length:126 start_codon:yes stop_codon:yes gene_type:complete